MPPHCQNIGNRYDFAEPSSPEQRSFVFINFLGANGMGDGDFVAQETIGSGRVVDRVAHGSD